jgi:hypothetical protein
MGSVGVFEEAGAIPSKSILIISVVLNGKTRGQRVAEPTLWLAPLPKGKRENQGLLNFYPRE